MTVKKHSVEWTLKVGAEGGAEVSALKAEIEKLGRIDAFAKLKRQTEDAKKEWSGALTEAGRLAKALGATQTASTELGAGLDAAKIKAGALKTEFENQKSALESQRRKTDELRTAWTEARTQVDELATAIKETGRPTVELSAAMDAAKKNAGALKAELGQQLGALKDTRTATSEARQAWKDADGEVKSMGQALVVTERNVARLSAQQKAAAASAARHHAEFRTGTTTLARMRGELSQAGVNTTKLASAQLQARSRVSALQAAMQSSNAEMGKTKVAAGSAAAGLNVLRSGVGGVQSALAGLMRFAPGGIVGIVAGITGGAAAGKAMEYAKIAADYQTIGVAMYVIGRNAGYTRKELDEVEKSLRKSGISMQESRSNIAKLVTAKIDLSKATVLARIAQDAAIPAQKNSSEAFGDLVVGIQSAQVEMLRTLGINVSFEQSYRDMAKQLGKNTTELTEAEKMQARLNIVIKTASGIAGTYEESLETVGKKISSLTRLEDDAKTKIGALFTPILAAGVDAYTWALKRLNDQMDNLISSSESGAKKSPLFSDGAAATGPVGAAIAGMLKFREYFTERMTLEKEAAEKSNAIEEGRAEKVKAINAELAEVRAQNLESFLEKAKSTLKEAEAAEKQYAEQVKKYQELRAQAQLSTQEKVRALLRTQMSDFDAYKDKQREAEESLAKARTALAGGDAEAGEAWAKKAQEQFAQLNSEVKTGEQVFVSAAEANRLAVEGVLAAGKALEESYLNREQAAEKSRISEATRMEQTKADIETLEETMSRIQDLEIAASVKDQATPVLESIQKELAQIKDKTITIKVNYDVGPRPKGLATGGRVPGYAFGGRLPGYSRTDNMLGMIRGGGFIGLAGGEDVTNALSSRVIYGAAPWLMPALNQVRTTADLSKVLAKIKGMQGFANGGRVSESYRVTLAAGDRETTMTTQSRAEYDGLKAFTRTLNKHKLVHGS